MDNHAALTALVKDALDSAVEVWKENGRQLVKLAKAVALSDSAIPSAIPGHHLVYRGEAEVDDFIALALDMRDSSNHLRVAISKEKADASQLERLYYETSALLPAAAWAVEQKGGRVTEFLGDGVLALFGGAKDEGEMHPARIYDALHAAEDCVGPIRGEINAQLAARFRLPGIDIGVGLAWSKCIVQHVGLPTDPHAKAVGECVYLATKFSKERNKILLDSALKCVWPKSKGGPLRFTKRDFPRLNLTAYEVSRAES